MECKEKKHFNLYYIFQEDQKEHPPPDGLLERLRASLKEHINTKSKPYKLDQDTDKKGDLPM